MKKLNVALMCLVVVGMGVANAWAVPAFDAAFKKMYCEGNSNAKFVEAVGAAKCDVCHNGKDKKVRNEYGQAVGKFLKKGDFGGDSKKYDPKSEEGMKVLAEGLKKAEGEKAASGKTFGEIIKAGELPAAAK